MFGSLLDSLNTCIENLKNTFIVVVHADADESPREDKKSNRVCKPCIDRERFIEPSNIRQDSFNVRGDCKCRAYMHSQCPLNRRELGRIGWAYLHTLAAYYPENPTEDQKQEMSTFVRTFAKWYPCGYCADMTRDEMIRYPPRVENQKEFSLWLCHIHNEVNDRMGKPIFDCSKVDERWKYGPTDGSCS